MESELAQIAYFFSGDHINSALCFDKVAHYFSKNKDNSKDKDNSNNEISVDGLELKIVLKYEENISPYTSIKSSHINIYNKMVNPSDLYTADHSNKSHSGHLSSMTDSSYSNSHSLAYTLLELSKNKPIFIISAVVNFGKSVYMSHKCCYIIIHSLKIILYYEPYGNYTKYDKNYSQVMLNFFETEIKTYPPSEKYKMYKEYTLHIYHKYFNLPIGIQQMMINYGDVHVSEFNTEIKRILENLRHHNITVDPADDKVDKTYRLCFLMDAISEYKSSSNAGISLDSKLNAIFKSAFKLYYKYSAKTCVSICLVEMFHLLKFIYPHKDSTSEYIEFKLDYTPDLKTKLESDLKQWYSTFTPNPSICIMQELKKLICDLYPDKYSKLFSHFAI